MNKIYISILISVPQRLFSNENYYQISFEPVPPEPIFRISELHISLLNNLIRLRHNLTVYVISLIEWENIPSITDLINNMCFNRLKRQIETDLSNDSSFFFNFPC